jgi:hypothetical protein
MGELGAEGARGELRDFFAQAGERLRGEWRGVDIGAEGVRIFAVGWGRFAGYGEQGVP